jgi:hypothetical protein
MLSQSVKRMFPNDIISIIVAHCDYVTYKNIMSTCKDYYCNKNIANYRIQQKLLEGISTYKFLIYALSSKDFPEKTSVFPAGGLAVDVLDFIVKHKTLDNVTLSSGMLLLLTNLNNCDIVDALINKITSIRMQHVEELKNIITSLIIKKEYSLLKTLFTKHIAIRSIFASDYSCLIMAGDYIIMDILLETRTLKQDKIGILKDACYYGNIDLIKLLISKYLQNKYYQCYNIALTALVENNEEGLVKMLLEKTVNKSNNIKSSNASCGITSIGFTEQIVGIKEDFGPRGNIVSSPFISNIVYPYLNRQCGYSICLDVDYVILVAAKKDHLTIFKLLINDARFMNYDLASILSLAGPKVKFYLFSNFNF